MPSRRTRLPVVAAALLSVGCYTLQPIAAPAAVGDKPVALDITDAGRVALGNSLGPPVRRIEGMLTEVTPTDYVVKVTSVDFLAGGSQTWTGEPIHLPREHVALAYQRQLSKGRTVAAGLAIAGVAAFIISRTVNGGGDPENHQPPRDSIGTTSRGPRP